MSITMTVMFFQWYVSSTCSWRHSFHYFSNVCSLRLSWLVRTLLLDISLGGTLLAILAVFVRLLLFHWCSSKTCMEWYPFQVCCGRVACRPIHAIFLRNFLSSFCCMLMKIIWRKLFKLFQQRMILIIDVTYWIHAQHQQSLHCNDISNFQLHSVTYTFNSSRQINLHGKTSIGMNKFGNGRFFFQIKFLKFIMECWLLIPVLSKKIRNPKLFRVFFRYTPNSKTLCFSANFHSSILRIYVKPQYNFHISQKCRSSKVKLCCQFDKETSLNAEIQYINKSMWIEVSFSQQFFFHSIFWHRNVSSAPIIRTLLIH